MAAAMLGNICAGSSHPPIIDVSQTYFPASADCQYKKLDSCSDGSIERATFSVAYYPGGTGMPAGSAIAVRFGNVLNNNSLIREDRNWPEPNFMYADMPEYTTVTIFKDGVGYPCDFDVNGAGGFQGGSQGIMCDICEENCVLENCAGITYLCKDKKCLCNKGAYQTCDFIKIVTKFSLSPGSESGDGTGLPGAPSSDGDRIVITYGDDTYASEGRYRVPNLPITQSVIVMERLGAPDPQNPFIPLHHKYAGFEYPVLEIGGAAVTDFEVIVPTVPADDLVTVTVKAMQTNNDASMPASMRNAYLVKTFLGAVRIEWAHGQDLLLFTRADRGMKEYAIDFGPDPSGIKTVDVWLDGDPSVRGTSNPIRFEEANEGQIYWGVLQSHSMQGGHANQTPEFCYEFARDTARLDFYSISEHCNTSYFDWDYMKARCDDYYHPGQPGDPDHFVTFLAYEWTSLTYGHRHVVFKDTAKAPQRIPCEECRSGSVYLLEDLDLFHAAFEEASAGLPPGEFDLQTPGNPSFSDVIIIPHHTARKAHGFLDGLHVEEGAHFNHDDYRFDWDYIWGDPASSTVGKQTLVEIFSTHGTSEHYIDPAGDDPAEHYLMENNSDIQLAADKHGFVRWALRNRHFFGFVAGSDNHFGTSGSLFGGTNCLDPQCDESVTFYSRGGLTAVRAQAPTREDIWDGLKSRRTYGTTGARMYLDVKINGHAMGEQFILPAAACPEIEVHVIGTDVISEALLVKIPLLPEFNGDNIPVDSPAEIVLTGNFFEDGKNFVSIYTDSTVLSPGQTYAYYVRVTQEDGHIAWSSPIWIDKARL
jgi:hypothetical protein